MSNIDIVNCAAKKEKKAGGGGEAKKKEDKKKEAAAAEPEEEMDATEEALAQEKNKKDPFAELPKGSVSMTFITLRFSLQAEYAN